MPIYRYLPYVLTVTGMVVLAITLRNPRARSARADEGPAAPVFANLEKAPAEPSASPLVQQAIDRLSEPRLGWLEAGVWLKSRLPEISCEGEGTYVRGPGQRFRLELRVRMDGQDPARPNQRGDYTVLSVSDGHDLWTACRIGPTGWRNVTRLRLTTILNAPAGLASISPVRQEFLSGQALRGVESMLRSLHTSIEWVRREDGPGEVNLTGRWKDGMLPGLLGSKKSWPAALPRFCRLSLRGPDRWPSRVEWWGPMEENGTDHLMAELEFRDPVFNHAVAPALSAGLFAFDPGAATVEDVTPRMSTDLDARAKQTGTGTR